MWDMVLDLGGSGLLGGALFAVAEVLYGFGLCGGCFTLKSSLLIEGDATLGVAILGVARGDDGLADDDDDVAESVACFFCSNWASSETGVESFLEDCVLLVVPLAE